MLKPKRIVPREVLQGGRPNLPPGLSPFAYIWAGIVQHMQTVETSHHVLCCSPYGSTEEESAAAVDPRPGRPVRRVGVPVPGGNGCRRRSGTKGR